MKVPQYTATRYKLITTEQRTMFYYFIFNTIERDRSKWTARQSWPVNSPISHSPLTGRCFEPCVLIITRFEVYMLLAFIPYPIFLLLVIYFELTITRIRIVPLFPPYLLGNLKPQRAVKKCTKRNDSRAKRLFGSLNFSFLYAVIAVVLYSV